MVATNKYEGDGKFEYFMKKLDMNFLNKKWVFFGKTEGPRFKDRVLARRVLGFVIDTKEW